MPEPTTPTPPVTEPGPNQGAAQPPQTPAPAPEPAAPGKPNGVSDAEWGALGDPGKAALIRERQAAAKAADDLAALRKEIEDSKKSAEQKAADDLKAAQAEAAANAAKALRYEIAAEHGIPLALASRLTGSTREEIAADAENLKTLIPAGATPPRTPAPDPGQGPRPQDPKSEADQAYEAIYGASKV